MGDDFVLSEKIVRAFDLVGVHPVQTEYDKEGNLLLKRDVKQFIEEIHKKLHNAKDMPGITKAEVHVLDYVDKVIDELAGDKLR